MRREQERGQEWEEWKEQQQQLAAAVRLSLREAAEVAVGMAAGSRCMW